MSFILPWIMSHEVVLASLVVAILDFIISINPAAQANSVVGWVLAQAHAIIGSVAQK